MVLESTMICFDSSNYMRNEDYLPSRLMAQIDCVNLICMSKLRAHPQNDFGLMTISNQVQVLTTLTNVVGPVYQKLNLIKPHGDLNFITGIRIAHLVLKNRQQKDHKMRIIAFVGSPMEATNEQLIQLAKKFKKEKVHVDVVNFGEYPENEVKLAEFVKTLNGNVENPTPENTSRLLTIPRGAALSQALRTSAILAGESLDNGSNSSNFDFDLDDDPDLALALRISMEEQRALEAAQQASRNAESSPPQAIAHLTQEEQELQRFLLLSTEQQQQQPTPPPIPVPIASSSTPQPTQAVEVDVDNMSEEELIAYVLRLSNEEANAEKASTESESNAKAKGEGSGSSKNRKGEN